MAHQFVVEGGNKLQNASDEMAPALQVTHVAL